jgi:lipopolysaccharide/colanic/teichoic acid biosynthesis glycosyltransferase
MALGHTPAAPASHSPEASSDSWARLLEPLPRRHAPTVLRPRYERAKRILEVGVLVLTLPVSLLAIAGCAFLVWLDDGRPVLFVQQRTGKSGRRFDLHKFRTMVRDAEARKSQLARHNRQTGPDFKIPDDPRITRIGRFLRRTSLDELPQIFDILRGEMSLIGPRPTSFDVSTYDLWHTERLEVRPGLTGLWQVSGRAEVDFDERVRLDVQYVQNRSLALDLWILVRTLRVLFDQRGAY